MLILSEEKIYLIKGLQAPLTVDVSSGCILPFKPLLNETLFEEYVETNSGNNDVHEKNELTIAYEKRATLYY